MWSTQYYLMCLKRLYNQAQGSIFNCYCIFVYLYKNTRFIQSGTTVCSIVFISITLISTKFSGISPYGFTYKAIWKKTAHRTHGAYCTAQPIITWHPYRLHWVNFVYECNELCWLLTYWLINLWMYGIVDCL